MHLITRTAGLLGVLCVVLAGCSKQEITQYDDARPVRAITAGRTDDPVGATYSGEIRARYESKLGFKVSGKVTDRLVRCSVQAQCLTDEPPCEARAGRDCRESLLLAIDSAGVHVSDVIWHRREIVSGALCRSRA